MKRNILSIMIVGIFTAGGTGVFANDATADSQRLEKSNPASPKRERDVSEPAGAAATESGSEARAPATADFRAAQDGVQAQFKAAKAQCQVMSGEALMACLADARAALSRESARLEQQWGEGARLRDKEARAEPVSGSERRAQGSGTLDPGSDSAQLPGNQAAKASAEGTTGLPSTGKSEYSAATDEAQSAYRDAKARCDVLQGAANGSCINEAKLARTAAMEVALAVWDAQGTSALADSDAMERSTRGMNAKGGMKPDAVGSELSPAQTARE